MFTVDIYEDYEGTRQTWHFHHLRNAYKQVLRIKDGSEYIYGIKPDSKWKVCGKMWRCDEARLTVAIWPLQFEDKP